MFEALSGTRYGGGVNSLSSSSIQSHALSHLAQVEEGTRKQQDAKTLNSSDRYGNLTTYTETTGSTSGSKRNGGSKKQGEGAGATQSHGVTAPDASVDHTRLVENANNNDKAWYQKAWDGTQSLAGKAYNRLNYESGLVLNFAGDVLSAPERFTDWITGTDAYDRFNMAIANGPNGDELVFGAMAMVARAGKGLKAWSGVSHVDEMRFSRMVSIDDADILRAGGTIDLSGRKGAGFIGDASELSEITTSRSMQEAMGVPYSPDFLLEFNLKDSTGLQNLLEYDDPLWRYGGKTLNGYSEFNMPGLTSDNITGWTLRELGK